MWILTVVRQRVANWADHRKRSKRGKLAHKAEKKAVYSLRRAGYEVLEKQPKTNWKVWDDGFPQQISVRADFLVSDGERTLIAEVKNSDQIAHIGYAPTRRQLLEYQIAYDVDGVLLVDQKNRQVHEIDFFDTDQP